MSADALRHVRHLAGVIGPRGTCTPQERAASEYCAQVLCDLGYEVRVQPFRARRSGWVPFSISSGLILLSLLSVQAFPSDAGRLIGAILATPVTISVLLQLFFYPSPLGWLVPKGPSQNVYAPVQPRGTVRRDDAFFVATAILIFGVFEGQEFLAEITPILYFQPRSGRTKQEQHRARRKSRINQPTEQPSRQ